MLLLWLNFIYFTDRNFACFRQDQCGGDKKRHGNVRLKCQHNNSLDFEFVSEEPKCHYVRTLFDLFVIFIFMYADPRCGSGGMV